MNRLQKAGYWMLDYVYSFGDEVCAALDGRSAEQYFEAVDVPDDERCVVRDDRPVVLVPGLAETWTVLRRAGAEARRHGHPVHVVSALGRTTGTVEAEARVVAQYLETNDLRDVILLSHSKGGLIGKYVMVRFDTDARIDGMIAINAPFSGSQWGRVVPLPSVRLFAPNDRIVRFLAATADVDARVVSVYSTFDQNVWAGSRLEGARNVRLNVAGHSRILGSKRLVRVLPEAISWLPRRSSFRTSSAPPGPSPR
ncbi:alpha/beta fold hydrolase [Subtercola endophyticus]|uniref:alpha/beta hydrolase n=1 Tax=Subtercola endophyticus TaxID=2895559 RepID=UPI001E363CA9|nr:alpha/beta hydrolase [Subtercola endophyticus]UFS59848.1 alpha/beta hydrolase [Subtercola endophyticus]